MEIIRRNWIKIISLLLIGLFLWSRFFKLNTTMFFINDMGRDLLVLRDWIETGKPPLLGPQTSAMPINQSAFYFYMLMPAFLLLNGSPMTLFITHAFIYIVSLILGLWVLRDKPKLQTGLLTIFFLVIISPQYLVQSRFIVWNPSFITPFLMSALITFYLLTEKFTRNRLIIFVFSLATAISFSYSVAPVFISIFIYILLFWKKNRIKVILSELMALLIINLPTVLFEIKHKFVLSLSLFSRGTMPQKANDISFIAKFNNLFGFGLSASGMWLVVSVIFLTFVLIWFSYKRENRILRFFSLILAGTIIITFIIPLTIHTHYIFGFTTLIFLCIAFLPNFPKFTIIGLMTLVYANSFFNLNTFKPASRTYDQMISCFNKICNDIKEPIFVSVQANFHPYHNGPEHRYMMKQAGCKVKYIEENPDSAKLMAVVLDDSSYVHRKTAYNELTMFGESKELRRYDCQSNFGVVILGK